MVDGFGSGIFLGENFDLAVDSTGDIKGVSGVSELQKDLSFQMVLNLSRFIGEPPSGNLQARIAKTAENVALADSRVDSVNTDALRVDFDRATETIEVVMIVRTESAEQELVFTV